MRPEPKIDRIFYTFQEAQEFLNISHNTLYKLMEQGLPSHKIGRKRVFLIKDLIQWIEEQAGQPIQNILMEINNVIIISISKGEGGGERENITTSENCLGGKDEQSRQNS